MKPCRPSTAQPAQTRLLSHTRPFINVFSLTPRESFTAISSPLHIPPPFLSYTSSCFQTNTSDTQRKAIISAKARASLLVKKYSSVAEKEGWKLWFERRDERVIHSEKLKVKVVFDGGGNLLAGGGMDMEGMVANVYGERFTREKEDRRGKIPALQPAEREGDGEEDTEETDQRKRSDWVHVSEFVIWEATDEDEQPAPSASAFLPRRTITSTPPRSSECEKLRKRKRAISALEESSPPSRVVVKHIIVSRQQSPTFKSSPNIYSNPAYSTNYRTTTTTSSNSTPKYQETPRSSTAGS